MPTTSQVNPEQVREMFEKELEKGYDIPAYCLFFRIERYMQQR